jgi:hypothetical protein
LGLVFDLFKLHRRPCQKVRSLIKSWGYARGLLDSF